MGSAERSDDATRRVKLLKSLTATLDDMSISILTLKNCIDASEEEISEAADNYLRSASAILQVIDFPLPLTRAWVESSPRSLPPQNVDRELQLKLTVAKSLTSAGDSLPENRSGRRSAQKRKTTSTRRDDRESDSETLIIATLVAHHVTADGIRQEPLSPTALGGGIDRAPGTVSRFYKKHFGNFKNWCRICSNVGELRKSLKKLDPSCLND